jgi:hypothetical protein
LIASHTIGHSFATNRYKTPTAVPIGIKEHSKKSLFLPYIKKLEDKDASGLIYEDLNKDKNLNETNQNGTSSN